MFSLTYSLFEGPKLKCYASSCWNQLLLAITSVSDVHRNKKSVKKAAGRCGGTWEERLLRTLPRGFEFKGGSCWRSASWVQPSLCRNGLLIMLRSILLDYLDMILWLVV